MMKLVREHTKIFRGISYISNKIPDSADRINIDSRNFVLCVNNTICRSGHDKDLASLLQISDYKYISTDALKHTIDYENGKYTIDFKQLNLSSGEVHDVKIRIEN